MMYAKKSVILMKKPAALKATDEVTIVGRAFGTPLVVKGSTWLPLTQLTVWAIMVRVIGKRQPDWPWLKCLATGVLTMTAILGSEWCHNLAHAAAARWVGKPMDAMRITWGMPLVVYYDVDDETVTPQQHVFRSSGGPLLNISLLLLSILFRRSTPPASVARKVAEAAVGMNAFLTTASLLPIPDLDGGPILKWTLVEHGKRPDEAEEIVRVANQVVGGGLGIVSLAVLKRGRRLWGILLGMLSILSLLVGFGVLEKQD
jgi:Zn-dependent protease